MMARPFLWVAFLLACLGPSGTIAQAPDPTDLRSLREELRALRERTQQLERRLSELEAVQRGTPPVPAPVPAPEPVPAPPSPPSAAPVDHPWTPMQPITVARSGQAYMNLSFGTLATAGWSTSPDVTADLELGHHDPSGRGFTLQSAEIALDGAVDPYFRGFGNLCFGLDTEGHTHVGLEEAYLLTTALPGNLQVKAGEFLAEFGRENTLHAQQWNFVDQALVLNRFFGPHGLRNPGARLSWLAPTPFYTELMLGVFNRQGDSAFSFRASDADATHGRASLDRGLRGPGDLLYVPRVVSSFDLSDTQALLVGASAAFGPNNSGADARSQDQTHFRRTALELADGGNRRPPNWRQGRPGDAIPRRCKRHRRRLHPDAGALGEHCGQRAGPLRRTRITALWKSRGIS
jgi:hypothetical protein